MHTLGNLTLTTSKLDINMSNRPWVEKLADLRLHTALQLNRDLLNDAPVSWDDQQIGQRGAALAKDVITIWPSASALLAARIAN